MPPSIIDTDTLSEIRKRKNPSIVAHASGYLSQYGHFTFSSITRYEVVRGLKAKSAARQLQLFITFCQYSRILPITDAILDTAADVWARAHVAGRPRNDADIFIAATAIEYGLILVTGNVAHHAWISGLRIQDWRQP
jgi:tRNA(fMet)-specific endonuclease VapC